MNCIYIGDSYYWESASGMSSIYELTKAGAKRTDWGFVQVRLAKGETVNIRPATREELVQFDGLLWELKNEQTI